MKPSIKIVLACVATAACMIGTTTIVAAKRVHSVSLSMSVGFVAPAVCEVSFAGQTFRLPDDQSSMVAALQKLRRKWRSISVSGGTGAPYKCIGQAIYLAERGGFEKVGFVAEPPER